MKSIFFFLSFVLITASLNAQEFSFFDKKFKRVKNRDSARYVADAPNPKQLSKIVDISKGFVYAMGVINDADTLSFDGKVLFYDDDRALKAIRYYKNGVLTPRIPVDIYLKKLSVQHNNNHKCYLIANEEGEFCAYKTYKYLDDKVYENIFATGKIVDTTSLTLDDAVTFYDDNKQITNIIRYNKGVEIPFLATTTDIKEPYDIIKIVSYSACNYIDVDTALECFKLKCKLTGADGVIGIHTSISVTPVTYTSDPITGSLIVIQGTAIKLKKKE
jgi:uncharacterized protein YbjQ (UPF0145 family)